MKTFEDFTGKYQLAKTLKFGLEPIGETLDNIVKHGFLEQDQHRAESYLEVKKIIDKYHKYFIASTLHDCKLLLTDNNSKDSLEEYYYYYHLGNKTEAQKKEFVLIQSKLRKQIVECLTKDDRFKRIDKKELIKEDLLSFIEDDREAVLVKEFADFTTYFTGFHENRKNMYSDEEKSTAIAYRLIHENLPRFIDNITVFEKAVAVPEIAAQLATLYSDLELYLNVSSIAQIFTLPYFSDTLTQTQIEVYNAVIGGKTEKGAKVKVKGLNEYINLYNQKQSDKRNRLPKLKPLYKQILSDREAVSWLPEAFKNDDQVLENIEKCYQELRNSVFEKKGEGEHSLKQLLYDLSQYDLSKVYIKNDQQLTDISQRMFGSWGVIEKAIAHDYGVNNPMKANDKYEKYEEKKTKYIKSQSSFSIQYINNCLDQLLGDDSKHVEDYFAELGAINTKTEQKENLFAQIANAYTDVKDLLNTAYPEKKSLIQDKENVAKIKTLLDAIKNLQHFVKPLLGDGTEPEKDERFYGEFTPLWDDLNQMTALYNKVRNYMTQKPYSKEKIKLFFENKGQFMGGWVDSQTEKSDNGTQAGSYLFRSLNSIGEYDYYLGVSSDSKLFRKKNGAKGKFEILDYYQIKSKSVYGSCYAGEEGFDKDKEILSKCIKEFVSQIQDNKIRLSISDDFSKLKAVDSSKGITPKALIDVLKDKYIGQLLLLLNDPTFSNENTRVIELLRQTILNLKRIPKAASYNDKTFVLFTEVQDVIEELCEEKVFGYFPIHDDEISLAMARDKKPLLLFKITNKDLSYADTFSKGLRKNRGTENLHTLYMKALLSDDQSVLDIGTGAIYYRKATVGLKKEPTHVRNLPINNKNILNEKKQSQFTYDLIKDRRYTYDSFKLHLSVDLNYNSPKKYNITPEVNEYLKESTDTHIIGIDRGERHLLYLSVIDTKGNIKEQYSLNEIVNEYNGNTYKTDYHSLLDAKEDKRNEARKSWQSIENIKELKEGYLSQVVHKITTLMVKYKAIVVLEDLNFGFMRGRQKVEKQVYQKFEKMLIDKLNYLVDKKLTPTEAGGLLKAYQLTSKFESFQKLGKQSGFLFYIPAWNTSKIDPVTGFVNLFDTHYESVDKAKAFFSKFDAVRYNTEKGFFEFSFDYTNFTQKAEGTKTKWMICTFGNRVETFRNPDKNSEWDNKEVCLTDEFKALFMSFGIDGNSNLKEAIANQDSKEFFAKLYRLLKLTLQMRNSKTGTDIDYLVSPVPDNKGNFYDSRICDDSLPANADANGAYNIARKGLWAIRQIKKAVDLKKVKLAISNKEWLHFAQTKPYLEED